ncbi:MAG: glycosyltransferase [Novosphingobium sp.]|nr:glycosyltransferase [Novosphingobium sp.]
MKKLDRQRFDVRMGLLRAAGPYLDQVDMDRVVVAADGEAHFNFDGPNSAQYRPAKLLGSIARGPLAFRRMIAERRPDVVMSFLKGTNLLTWLALGQMRRRPSWIAREGNNVLEVIREEAPNRLVETMSLGLTRRAYARADAVLTNSSDMCEGLVGDLGLDPAKMRMINNPVDLAEITELADGPISGAPNRPFILSAGRLEHQKAHDVLIRAYAMSGVWRSHTLVILGKGSLLGPLHRLAAQLGVGEHVQFIGFVANPYAWMKRADLFVLPSRWEGFPTVAAEAMACGAPLLMTDFRFGIRDVAIRDESVVVAIDDDAALAAGMAALIGDPHRRARMRAAGRAHVPRFALEPMLDGYAALFDEIAVAGAARRGKIPEPVSPVPALLEGAAGESPAFARE